MRALAAIAVAGLLVGCSFPEIELVPEDAAQSGLDAVADGDDAIAFDSSGAETSFQDAEPDAGDATSDPDVQTDAPIDAQGDAKPDAVSDAVSDVAPCESGDPCDCDGDGDKKPGPGCGGGDCDDGDPRRNSKVSTFQTHSVAGAGHGGDWNCSGTVERELGNGGVSCGGLALGPCAATSGYKQANPTCGGSATFVKCKVTLALLCGEDETQTETITVKCK